MGVAATPDHSCFGLHNLKRDWCPRAVVCQLLLIPSLPPPPSLRLVLAPPSLAQTTTTWQPMHFLLPQAVTKLTQPRGSAHILYISLPTHSSSALIVFNEKFQLSLPFTCVFSSFSRWASLKLFLSLACSAWTTFSPRSSYHRYNASFPSTKGLSNIQDTFWHMINGW